MKTGPEILMSLGQEQPRSGTPVSGIMNQIRTGQPWTIANAAFVGFNRKFLERRLASSSVTIQMNVAMNPTVMHGNPVFKGTRIPLYTVLEELADGGSLRQVLEAYPSLKLEQLQAGLDFVSSLLRLYDDQISGR